MSARSHHTFKERPLWTVMRPTGYLAKSLESRSQVGSAHRNSEIPLRSEGGYRRMISCTSVTAELYASAVRQLPDGNPRAVSSSTIRSPHSTAANFGQPGIDTFSAEPPQPLRGVPGVVRTAHRRRDERRLS